MKKSLSYINKLVYKRLNLRNYILHLTKQKYRYHKRTTTRQLLKYWSPICTAYNVRSKLLIKNLSYLTKNKHPLHINGVFRAKLIKDYYNYISMRKTTESYLNILQYSITTDFNLFQTVAVDLETLTSMQLQTKISLFCLSIITYKYF